VRCVDTDGKYHKSTTKSKLLQKVIIENTYNLQLTKILFFSIYFHSIIGIAGWTPKKPISTTSFLQDIQSTRTPKTSTPYIVNTTSSNSDMDISDTEGAYANYSKSTNVQGFSKNPNSAASPSPTIHQIVGSQKNNKGKCTNAPSAQLTFEQANKKLKNKLNNDTAFPLGPPIKPTIGKKNIGLMWPRTYATSHAAAPLLNSYAQQGCPVNCGPDWGIEQIKALLTRGPHRSAKSKQAAKQLLAETTEKIKNGYARVVKWGDIKHAVPPKLKISPVAMIPHKSRAYRCILDLSFKLFAKGKSFQSVNESTVKKSKDESMVQLGTSIYRIVAAMADQYNLDWPFAFAKLDIKDGFWRLAVSDEDAWNFCYTLPCKDGTHIDDIEIVVPNCSQMGWCESPPLFCSSSETARDVMQELVNKPTLPEHEFESIMMDGFEQIENAQAPQDKSTTLEVFVDDFIAATNDLRRKSIRHLSRTMLHGAHSVYPPPTVTKHQGEDPISKRKLENGEGKWEHVKEILGWIFNGKDFTIQLPPSKCTKLNTMLRKTKQADRVSLNHFQKLAGSLQHASFGIPGGKALFSPIQRAMAKNPDFITITPLLRETLQDWQYMIKYMASNPTSVLQLVSEYPNFVGYSDACKLGAGGVWSSGTEQISPFLWQQAWPIDIQEALVTDDNPNGSITINDLELAGAVLNWLALEHQQLNLKHKHVATFCDNTSAVAWAYKLRTSKSIVAGKLLRMLGLRIHARHASSVIPKHVAGDDNAMADIVSRAFKHGKYFEAEQNLTSYFNKHFVLPQKASWREFQIPQSSVSLVISCLRGTQLDLASLLGLSATKHATGPTGQSMQLIAASTHSSKRHLPSSEISSLQPLLLGSGQERTEKAFKSVFKGSRMRFRPLERPSNWLQNKTPSTSKMESTTLQSSDCSKATEELTPRQSLSSQSPSPSQCSASEQA
jgi:hypothetical protein